MCTRVTYKGHIQQSFVKMQNQKLCIGIDPSALNQAIGREHYQIKMAKEIFGCLAGVQYFSTLDLQVALDTESSYATPFRVFQFLHLPFGRSSVPVIPQNCY